MGWDQSSSSSGILWVVGAAVIISDGLSAGDTYLRAVVGEYETVLRKTVF